MCPIRASTISTSAQLQHLLSCCHLVIVALVGCKSLSGQGEIRFMRWSSACLLMVVIGLTACSPSPSKTAQASNPAPSRTVEPEPVKVEGPSGPLLFHGYACTIECGLL